jgi:hypothetical protein
MMEWKADTARARDGDKLCPSGSVGKYKIGGVHPITLLPVEFFVGILG